MAVQTTYSDFQDMGYTGMPATPDRNQYIVGKNVEASAQIPAGFAVMYDLSSPQSDISMLLPALETDVPVGIVSRKSDIELAWTDSDGIVHGQFGATGFLVGALFNVAVKGRLLVVAEDAVVPGDKLFVRCTAGGAGEFVGGLTNADEGTETIDCTNAGQWRSTAAAGGLAWLDFDFTGDLT